MTHGIKFLPSCDVIVMMSDGVIAEMGTYSELMNNKGPFAQFIETYQSTNNGDYNCILARICTHYIIQIFATEHDEEKCLDDVTFKVHEQQWELHQQQKMLLSEIHKSYTKSESESISGEVAISILSMLCRISSCNALHKLHSVYIEQ